MRRIHTLSSLTQQEQIHAQSQGGSLSPAGGGGGGSGGGGFIGGSNEAKAVDIIQMLTKARSDYDKVSTFKSDLQDSSSSMFALDSLFLFY